MQNLKTHLKHSLPNESEDFFFFFKIGSDPVSFKCSERHMTHETAFCVTENMATHISLTLVKIIYVTKLRLIF